MKAASFFTGLIISGSLAALAIGDPLAREAPDDQLTPGIVASTDINEVCGYTNGLTYSKAHRATSAALKHLIRTRDQCDPRNSEVDHRCALALGCADVKENLWCQPGPAASVVWNYHDKDQLEVYVWEAVCKKKTMSLKEGQAVFLAPADWRKEYCKVFSDRRC